MSEYFMNAVEYLADTVYISSLAGSTALQQDWWGQRHAQYYTLPCSSSPYHWREPFSKVLMKI